MAKRKYLSDFTTELAYVRGLIRHAAATAIEYSPLNTNRPACEEHTDELADVLLAATIDYLSKASISVDTVPHND